MQSLPHLVNLIIDLSAAPDPPSIYLSDHLRRLITRTPGNHSCTVIVGAGPLMQEAASFFQPLFMRNTHTFIFKPTLERASDFLAMAQTMSVGA